MNPNFVLTSPTLVCSYFGPKRLPFLCAFAGQSTSTMFRIALAACAIALSSAVELTPDNWDEETSGKSVFIKVSFFSALVLGGSLCIISDHFATPLTIVSCSLVRPLQKDEARVCAHVCIKTFHKCTFTLIATKLPNHPS